MLTKTTDNKSNVVKALERETKKLVEAFEGLKADLVGSATRVAIS